MKVRNVSYVLYGLILIGKLSFMVGQMNHENQVSEISIDTSQVQVTSVEVVTEVGRVKPTPLNLHSGVTEAKKVEAPSKQSKALGEFTITAYDLTETCCGKHRDEEDFGITAYGYSLVGLSRKEAMTIAADPKVLSKNSKVRIEFEGSYAKFSGVYTVRDTGSAIKGRKLDLFVGDYGTAKSVQSTIDFGTPKAKVYLLEEES
jgi:3D (Asp-Asp-Asp) domain-containing protein